MNKKLYLIVLFLILGSINFNCKKKSVYIEKVNIEKLTKLNNIKIKIEKKYNVFGSSLVENIIVFQSNKDSYLGIFTAQKQNNSLIKLIKLSNEYINKKIIFISPAISYSHIILLQQNKKSRQYSLLILDSQNLKQRIPISNTKLKSMYVEKNKKPPFDEMIFIKDSIYRFDSQRYIETFYDSPFPFIKQLDVKEEKSYIKIINRGFYTPRSYITISFPDLTKKNFHDFVRLTQKIATVRLYHPGQFVYMKEGNHKVRKPLKYYMIEITKSPFINRYSMKLPIYLKPGLGRILLRISYSYQGEMINWPLDSQELSDKVILDQQNYKAYVFDK